MQLLLTSLFSAQEDSFSQSSGLWLVVDDYSYCTTARPDMDEKRPCCTWPVTTRCTSFAAVRRHRNYSEQFLKALLVGILTFMWRLCCAGAAAREGFGSSFSRLFVAGRSRISERIMKAECLTSTLRAGALSRSFNDDHLTGSNMSSRAQTIRNFSRSSTITIRRYRVYLAVGSNLGDRYANIRRALQLLVADDQTRLVRTSFLHETAPMYVTDQPAFLNGAVCIETDLEPLDLLRRIKEIEEELGRDFAMIRNGPRTIDLDILLSFDNDNQDVILDDPKLAIPHPRIQERDFVLLPLLEVAGKSLRIPGSLNTTIGDALDNLQQQQREVNGMAPAATAVRVLPLPRSRMLYFNETVIMGILNVTPDSFSDGGKWTTSARVAVDRALAMEQQGAGIIDIGGESTRPGALEMAVEEEIRRTIPIIQGIRQRSDIPISIDTRHAAVARAAIAAGADIVNDVSGGTFDPDMLQTVGELGVGLVIMHMRGTPETMQTLTTYDDVVSEVADALADQSNRAAEEHGVHRWTQVIDPGIGFAKDLHGNLLLLQNIGHIRSRAENLPVLIGSSRKGFIGKIAGVTVAEARDPGTIASFVAALCLEKDRLDSNTAKIQRCNIVRVHNVDDCKQAARIMDAIQSAR